MNYKNLLRSVITAAVVVLNVVQISPVYAQDTELQKVFQQLSVIPIVRANFEQQKKLASINKVYVSKGMVLFSKTNGVLWQIQTPVTADLIVTPKKLVQKTQRTYSQIDVEKTPYGSVATMFLQLMSGNEAALAKNFNVVSAQYSPTAWSVILTPKSSLFKKLFDKIEAQGQHYVNRIVIHEKDGNSTIIRFSQQTSQPQNLTAAENALFQLAK